MFLSISAICAVIPCNSRCMYMYMYQHSIYTCVYVVGYLRSASSVSKFLGSLLSISAATSSSTSSSDLPSPDVVRA